MKDTASEDTLFGTGKGIIFQINSPIEQYWGQILVSASGRENKILVLPKRQKD